MTLSYRAGQGQLCPGTQGELAQLADGVPRSAEGFSTDQLCWPTGIRLEEGVTYTVWIEMVEPFFDRTIVADTAGFQSASPRHRVASVIRRWWSADWFQPIARIGDEGGMEWPLQAIDGARPARAGENGTDPLPELRLRREGAAQLGVCDAIPAEERAEARAIHEAQPKLRRTLVSRFAAPASGELFLYVNDALMAVPFGPTVQCFYENNSGKARVTVARTAAPSAPFAAPVSGR